MKNRKPRPGDYYEGIKDRDAIDPKSGLTWSQKYQRDLQRWEEEHAKSLSDAQAVEAFRRCCSLRIGDKCLTISHNGQNSLKEKCGGRCDLVMQFEHHLAALKTE